MTRVINKNTPSKRGVKLETCLCPFLFEDMNILQQQEEIDKVTSYYPLVRSKTQLELLKVMAFKVNKTITTGELAESIDVNPYTVNRAVQTLKKKQLVDYEHLGNGYLLLKSVKSLEGIQDGA